MTLQVRNGSLRINGQFNSVTLETWAKGAEKGMRNEVRKQVKGQVLKGVRWHMY